LLIEVEAVDLVRGRDEYLVVLDSIGRATYYDFFSMTPHEVIEGVESMSCGANQVLFQDGGGATLGDFRAEAVGGREDFVLDRCGDVLLKVQAPDHRPSASTFNARLDRDCQGYSETHPDVCETRCFDLEGKPRETIRWSVGTDVFCAHSEGWLPLEAARYRDFDEAEAHLIASEPSYTKTDISIRPRARYDRVVSLRGVKSMHWSEDLVFWTDDDGTIGYVHKARPGHGLTQPAKIRGLDAQQVCLLWGKR
jgi:hypothetical protein